MKLVSARIDSIMKDNEQHRKQLEEERDSLIVERIRLKERVN